MVTDYRRFECTLTPEDGSPSVMTGICKPEVCIKALDHIDESEAEYFHIRLSGFDKDGAETVFLNFGEGTRPLHRSNLVRIIDSWGAVFEHLNSTTFDTSVTKCGNSLVLKITEQCRLMGLNPGDTVRVKMERSGSYGDEDDIGRLFRRKRTAALSPYEMYVDGEESRGHFERFVRDYHVVGSVSLGGIRFDIRDMVIDHYSAVRTREGNVILVSMPYDNEGDEEYARAFADAHGLEYDYINDYSWYHRGETQLVIFWLKGAELSVDRS